MATVIISGAGIGGVPCACGLGTIDRAVPACAGGVVPLRLAPGIRAHHGRHALTRLLHPLGVRPGAAA